MKIESKLASVQDEHVRRRVFRAPVLDVDILFHLCGCGCGCGCGCLSLFFGLFVGWSVGLLVVVVVDDVFMVSVPSYSV